MHAHPQDVVGNTSGADAGAGVSLWAACVFPAVLYGNVDVVLGGFERAVSGDDLRHRLTKLESGVINDAGTWTVGNSLSLSFRGNLANRPFTVFRPWGTVGG